MSGSECEKKIQKRLADRGDIIHSNDLSDLEPKTEREYLMIMWPTQKAILKHLEGINSFKESIAGRVGALEATWKVGGAIILISLTAMAVKIIFG